MLPVVILTDLDIGHWTSSLLRILRIGGGQLLVILVLRIRGTVVATREACPPMFAQIAVEIVCLDKTAKGFQLRALARLHGRIELLDVVKVARRKVEAHNLKLTVAGRFNCCSTVQTHRLLKARKFARPTSICIWALGVILLGPFWVTDGRM